jgi:hypothetical protein
LCQLFYVLLRKLKQQWAKLYCTDVGAGVKKDSGPYTFVHHATDRGEYRQTAGTFATTTELGNRLNIRA